MKSNSAATVPDNSSTGMATSSVCAG